MSEFLGSRCVLAVRSLEVSTEYFTAMLGFSRDVIDAPGWSFLSRDEFRLMLGECPDALPASELGDHSWFAQVTVDNVDEYHAEVLSRGCSILSPLETKPWGVREFSVRSPDGHRIGFVQIMEGRG